MSVHKSFYTTPNPHHTPRYAGFIPQYKYQFGNTFGQTTAGLMRNPNVATSGRRVLTENTAPPQLPPQPQRQPSSDANHKRDGAQYHAYCWVDPSQKPSDRYLPGYTGFVPRTANYFGKRYSENCHQATKEFENETRKHSEQLHELKVIDAIQSGKISPRDSADLPKLTARTRTPLVPISYEAKPFISKDTAAPISSPYYMSNSNPHKCFKSGYGGFVPRTRGLLGMGYPHTTNVGLNTFTDSTKRQKELISRPVTLVQHPLSVEHVPADYARVYTIDSGLIPHYAGHIPGEKFNFGNTFGYSTINALRHPTRAVSALN